nr:uncharacterized protein LOC109154744 [Ipomoea trifida]
MKRSKKAKPHVPRRGTSQPKGVDSSSIAEYTGDPTTIIMNPVPVSQVPFQDIQDNRASLATNLASLGNSNSPSFENEEIANPMPMAANLGENAIANPDDKTNQSLLAIDRACQPLDEESKEERVNTQKGTFTPKPRVPNLSPSDTLEKDLYVFLEEERETEPHNEDTEINFHPVTNIEPYEESVIHEFYNNLGARTSIPSDPMYGKIYLRGKFYDFTPSLINDYMGTSTTESSANINSEQVAQELTAGNVSFEKNKIKAASLTSKYAILQKIALVNWMPSLHENTIKWSLAELLYKIGKRIKINFGEIVHSQIMNLVGNGTPKASLIFPNLIYTLLVQQALKQQKPTIPVKTLSITIKLRKGTHQNDLTTTTPKEDRTDKTILLKYFQKRLKEIVKEEKRITKRHLELKEEKTEKIFEQKKGEKFWYSVVADILAYAAASFLVF